MRTALLLTILLATAAQLGGAPARAASRRRCVWSKGADAKVMGPYLKSWASRHGLGALGKWGVSIEPQQARISLTTDRPKGVYSLRLSAECRHRPRVASLKVQGARPPPRAALEDLARTFPAPRKQLHPGWHGRSSERAPYSWAFVLAALGLVLLAWGAEQLRAPWRRVAFWLTVAGATGLLAAAAAPLFTIPFSCDTGFLRAAYAAENIFGDWNHPFLPYALNHLPTRFSLEPWALRIIPFGWLVAQTVVLMVVARRQGGLVAATLASTWLACEVRHRPGIDVLADWDLASAFLLGLVLWAHGAEPPNGEDEPNRRWIWLAVLLLLGFYASYMMLVPITVLVALLWLDPQTRGRTAQVATGIWLLCAIKAVGVFRQGAALTPIVTSFDDLAHQMFLDLPLGRTEWMGIPLAAGLVWLVWGWRRLDRRLLLGTALAIPAATVVAWKWSHVNQGYYICLITPLLLLAAGVAVSRGGQRLHRWTADRTHPLVGWTVVAAGLTGLTLLTVYLAEVPAHKRFRSTGLANLPRFDRRVDGDDRPILTTTVHLGLYWSYDRARRGAKRPGRMLPGAGPPDVAHRLRQVLPPCRPKGGWPAAGRRFYYVTESGGTQHRPCMPPPSRYRCKRLYKRTTWLNFYDCSRRRALTR
jgi:hypothetical protein